MCWGRGGPYSIELNSMTGKVTQVANFSPQKHCFFAKISIFQVWLCIYMIIWNFEMVCLSSFVSGFVVTASSAYIHAALKGNN